jgi:hypothetical protein
MLQKNSGRQQALAKSSKARLEPLLPPQFTAAANDSSTGYPQNVTLCQIKTYVFRTTPEIGRVLR